MGDDSELASGIVANLELGERRTMEGPKVPSEARRRVGSGTNVPEKFSKKSTLKSPIFSIFVS